MAVQTLVAGVADKLPKAMTLDLSLVTLHLIIKIKSSANPFGIALENQSVQVSKNTPKAQVP